jgi:hypothetical protein
VALCLPTHEIAVNEINGTVQITPEALTTTSLTGNVGSAPVTVQGQIQHYRSSQHQGELQLTFSDIPDQIVAPSFPDRFVVVNNGTFSGNAKVAFSPGKKIATSGAVQLRGIQSDPLRFLCPFTIAAGGVALAGAKWGIYGHPRAVGGRSFYRSRPSLWWNATAP